MTSAGGPSSGPRGPSGPRPDSIRGKCQATSRKRRQPDGARSSGSSLAARTGAARGRGPTSCRQNGVFALRKQESRGFGAFFRKLWISRTTWRGRLRGHAERHVGAVHLDRLVAFLVQPARGARRDDAVLARPESERRHRRLVGDPRDRRLVDLVPGDPFVEPPDIVLRAGRRRRASPGSPPPAPCRAWPRQLAGKKAAEAPADDQHRLSVRRSRRGSASADRRVSAWRPGSSPAPSRARGSPPRPAPGAAPCVVRSLAMKPGMTSAGGPSSGPRGPRSAEAAAHPRQQEQPPRAAASSRAAARSSPRTHRSEKLSAPISGRSACGQPDAAVLGLVVLQQRHQDPRARPAPYC